MGQGSTEPFLSVQRLCRLQQYTHTLYGTVARPLHDDDDVHWISSSVLTVFVSPGCNIL